MCIFGTCGAAPVGCPAPSVCYVCTHYRGPLQLCKLALLFTVVYSFFYRQKNGSRACIARAYDYDVYYSLRLWITLLLILYTHNTYDSDSDRSAGRWVNPRVWSWMMEVLVWWWRVRVSCTPCVGVAPRVARGKLIYDICVFFCMWHVVFLCLVRGIGHLPLW